VPLAQGTNVRTEQRFLAWLVLILLHGLGAIQVVIYVVVYAYGAAGTQWRLMYGRVHSLDAGSWCLGDSGTSAECEKQVGWNLRIRRVRVHRCQLLPGGDRVEAPRAVHNRLIHIICFAFLCHLILARPQALAERTITRVSTLRRP
jgi:hypothetical protein